MNSPNLTLERTARKVLSKIQAAVLVLLSLAILLPENSYGFLSVVGTVLVRTFGVSIFFLIAWVLLPRLFDFQFNKWKTIILTCFWLSFAQAASGPMVPLLGGLIETPFRLAFGDGSLIAGGIVLLGVAKLLKDSANGTGNRQGLRLRPLEGQSEKRTAEQITLTPVEKEVLSALCNLGYEQRLVEPAIKQAGVRDDFDLLLKRCLQLIEPTLTRK